MYKINFFKTINKVLVAILFTGVSFATSVKKNPNKNEISLSKLNCMGENLEFITTNKNYKKIVKNNFIFDNPICKNKVNHSVLYKCKEVVLCKYCAEKHKLNRFPDCNECLGNCDSIMIAEGYIDCSAQYYEYNSLDKNGKEKCFRPPFNLGQLGKIKTKNGLNVIKYCFHGNRVWVLGGGNF